MKVIHVPRSAWWLLLVLYLPLCGKTKGVLQHKPMIWCQAIKDLTFIWNLKIFKSQHWSCKSCKSSKKSQCLSSRSHFLAALSPSWIPWSDAIRTRWAAIVRQQNGAATWLGSDFQELSGWLAPKLSFRYLKKPQTPQVSRKNQSSFWKLPTFSKDFQCMNTSTPFWRSHKFTPFSDRFLAFSARPERFGPTTGRFRCTEGGHRPHWGTAALVRGGTAQWPRGHVAGGAMMDREVPWSFRCF